MTASPDPTAPVRQDPSTPPPPPPLEYPPGATPDERDAIFRRWLEAALSGVDAR